jgi:hypothetical protein
MAPVLPLKGARGIFIALSVGVLKQQISETISEKNR